MKGLPDSRSGLIIGDLLASLAQKMIFQLTDKVQEGIARFPPLSRSYGSEAVSSQDPWSQQTVVRRNSCRRKLLINHIWIPPRPNSTKPIMASKRASENFVARWCSGLA